MDYYEFWKVIMFMVVVIAAVFVGTQIGIYLVLREIKKAIKETQNGGNDNQ